jgi:hypothetical protein
MLHTVEVRFSEDNFRYLLLQVRGWLNSENVWPSTFRYWLSEPASVLRVNFESEEEARAFAAAFGGVVLTADAAFMQPPGGAATNPPEFRLTCVSRVAVSLRMSLPLISPCLA